MSLTLYGSTTASSTLSTAATLVTSTGGTSTSKTTTAPNDSSQKYMEVLGLGGTGTTVTSLPSPTGKGWLYDSTALEGFTLSGTIAAILRMNDSSGFASIDLLINAWKRSSGGTYTSIGSTILSAQSMSGTATNYSLSASSITSTAFSTGDKLYIEHYMHPQASDGHWTGDPIVNFSSSSSSAGIANQFQITISGLAATGTVTNKDVTMRGKVSAQGYHDITLRGKVSAQGYHDVKLRGNVGNTTRKDITVRGRVSAQGYHDITLRGKVSAQTHKYVSMRGNIIARNASGQFGLWANGTGTAIFGNTFRCTQYPDPALSLAPVLPYVSSSSVFWTENIPNSTSRALAVSTDGSGNTWTDVTGQNGGTIPILNSSGAVLTDVFTSNTSANYTSTSKTGGSTASVTYDTVNSRATLSGGSGALYLSSSITTSNIDILCDQGESDAGGLAWCEVDTSNYYELGVYDDSSSGGFTNQLRLYKVLSNTRSLLSSASIVFHRSTPGTSPYHRTRVVMQSGVITVSFDGVQVISYTDGSPLAPGKCGLRNDGGTSRYYQFRAQALGDYVSGTPAGDIVSGKFLYTKIAPSSSDATTTPQILTLTTSVRSPDIDAGPIIPLLHIQTYPVSVMLNNEFDTLAKASGDYHWNVDRGTQPTFTSQLSFNQRGAKVAPFCLYSTDLLFTPKVTPSGSADLYRDMETIYNCVQTITVTNEPFAADGTTTSWSMAYPLYSAPTIVINNVVQSIGVSGVDTGRGFYWTPNSTSITQDSSATALTAGTIGFVSYTGIGARQSVTASNAAGQAAQATLEQNSGIVEHVLDGSSVFGLTSLPMTVAQAQTYAQGLLNRYSYNNAIDLVASTTSDLLAGRPAPVCGQLLPVFLPEFSVNNQQLLVVKVTKSGVQKADGNVLYQYDIEATNGANLQNWTQPLF